MLLTRNYLAFTLALLLIAFGVYGLWTLRINALFSYPDIDALISSPELHSGDYNKLSSSRLLKGSLSFAVLDDSGVLIYRSSESIDVNFTADELLCIPPYTDGYSISSVDYVSENGEKHQILSIDNYDNNDDLLSSVVLTLDKDLNILSGDFAGKKSFTSRELGLLTNELPEDFELYRYQFISSEGNPQTLLFQVPRWTAARYEKANSSALRIWLLLIPLYIAAAGGFVIWLNRKIRRPLKKLDNAIVGLADGKTLASDCGGPREIRQIGENFDRMAAQLAESELERRRLDEGRQKLIADISHDLKTPITVISGYARAICDGKIQPDETNRYLELIDSKATALAELINSFHEYSKTQHPQFNLSLKVVELCEFFRSYLAEKYNEISLAGFTLELSIPDTQLYSSIDEFQLKRALDNIFSNSLRHNTLGTILFFKLTAAKDKVFIRIGDNGIGIPASLKDSIFEPFTVGSDSRSDGGSGLGLAITKRILIQHGGNIRLLVPPSSGLSTEFEIEFPRSQQA